MSKVYRVRKLSELEASSIEEAKFGDNKEAHKQVVIKYMNEEKIVQLTVGYDSLKGMLCAGIEMEGETYVSHNQKLVNDIVAESCDDTTSVFQEKIYQSGKTVKPFTGFDVLKDGGKLAGHWMNSTLDNVADSSIYIDRGSNIDNDDSSAYVYSELTKVNGMYSKERVSKEHMHELMSSASAKSAELLMPVMGDSIGAILRRTLALNTFIEFCINKGEDDFIKYLESYKESVIEVMENDKNLPGLQEDYLKKGEVPSYKRKAELTRMIEEEKDIIKTLGTEMGKNPAIPKNFIDLMYITELVDTVKENTESLSNSVFHSYIFDTDRVVAGARLAYAVGETLQQDILWLNDDAGPCISGGGITPESAVRDFLGFLDKNGVEDTQAMYDQYFHNGKSFGSTLLAKLKNSTSNSKLEQVFLPGKKGSKFKNEKSSDEFSKAISKLSGNKGTKFNKTKGEDSMRITSKNFGGKSKMDIKEYTMDGETFYVDMNDVRDFDGTEAAVVYNADEDIIGAMAENGDAIDTNGNEVGRMKEKSSSGFGKKSSGFGSSKSSGFGSKSSSGFGKKSSGFGSSKSSGFGSKSSSGFGKKSSGFGSKSLGTPCMIPNDDTVFFVTKNIVEAFGEEVMEIVNDDNVVVGGVTEDGELMSLEGKNIGDIILEEEKASSGFGKKSSGFGSKSSSGFGKKSSGFGSKSSSGFGSSSLKDNPAAMSLREKLRLIQ